MKYEKKEQRKKKKLLQDRSMNLAVILYDKCSSIDKFKIQAGLDTAILKQDVKDIVFFYNACNDADGEDDLDEENACRLMFVKKGLQIACLFLMPVVCLSFWLFSLAVAFCACVMLFIVSGVFMRVFTECRYDKFLCIKHRMADARHRVERDNC